MTITYAVTTDIPAGISRGMTFGSDINAASDYFGEAARGTYPKGTVVTIWEQRGEDFAEGTTHTAIDTHTHS